MFCYNRIFGFKYCLVLRVSFPEEIDRDYSQLPVVRPFGCSGCCAVTCRCVCACFLGCHMVMLGYDLGQVGGNDSHAGVIHKFW